jgi:hypothetical protein
MLMFEKTKTNIIETAHCIGVHAGLVAMSAAVAAGFLETAYHERKVALVPQPAYVSPGVSSEALDQFSHESQQRREREETHPHGSSYGVSQRTPGRTGRV